MIAQAVPATPAHVRQRKFAIPVEWLIAGLLCLFALDNILLLHFFGLPALATAILVVVAWIGISRLVAYPRKTSVRVPLSTLVIAVAVSLMLFLLGGEGRFFYATPDWQIRDAVLADLASHDWPFAYDLHGVAHVLRAPLGMYLLPALAGKGHDLALLISNSVRLALLIAIGWQLYDGPAKRWIALAIFLLFSGWDALGLWLKAPFLAFSRWDHIEGWNMGFQYSSTVTLAFWAPNHAIAGWSCALLFILWRRGLAPVGVFAACIPLVALWSPLAIMGAMPFALLAGASVLRNRGFGWRDVGLAALALLIAVPVLFYEHIDAAAVKTGPRIPEFGVYMGVLAFEVLPLILFPLRARTTSYEEKLTLWIVLICLMLLPLWSIGASHDFQTRVSIVPLALLMFAFADWVTRMLDQHPLPRFDAAYVVVALMIGSVTPMFEVKRLLQNGPSSAPYCSLVGAWSKQTGMIVPPTTYLARRSAMPPWLDEIPVQAGRNDPSQCWDHEWFPVYLYQG